MQRFLAYFVLVATIYFGVSLTLASVVVDYRDPIDRTNPEWRAIYAPDWGIPPSNTVEITNGDKVLVADIYEHPSEADCAVIIAHGLRGDRNLVRLYGTMFYNLGCDVLGYDFAPRNNSNALLTYGYEEKSDLAAVVDWLADYTALPKSRIGIWGGSYGAATTLQLLAEEDELAWVIADSSFASMPRLLDEQAENLFGMAIEPILPTTYFIIERRLGFNMDVVSPEDSVVGNDVPLLLLHSTADELIYAQNSQAIYANTNPETTRLIYMDWGSAHMQSYIDNPETYTHYVYAFLRKFAPDFSSTLTPQQSLTDSPRIDQITFVQGLKQQIIPHPEPTTPDMSAFIE